MKQNKLDEQWLDEIRQTMADHEEELPADGWEKIAAAMAAAEEVQPEVAPVQPQQPRIIPLWLRRAAVAIVLCAIGAGGLYYFSEGPTTEDPILTSDQQAPMGTPSVTTTAVDSATIQQAETTPLLTNIQPSVKQQSTIKQHNEPITAAQSSATETASSTEILPETSISNTEIIVEPTSVTEKADEQLTDMHTEEQAVLLAMETTPVRSSSAERSWNIGVRLGHNGSSDQEIEGSYDLMDSPDYEYIFPGTSTDYVAPKDEVYDSENHLSWSAGISVSKRLNERLSLESGLVYTYLTSDVTLSRSGRQHQQLHYLGIPIKLNLMLFESAHWQFYASTGTMLEHSLYGKRGNTNLHINDWQWSMNGGLGLQRQLTHHMGLYIEPGVNYYFSNGSEVPSLRTESPFSFNLQIGVRFGL